MPISKSREEIELSAARNCFLCQMMRTQYVAADRLGGPAPFKIDDIVHYDDHFFGGKWHLHDWAFAHKKGFPSVVKFYRSWGELRLAYTVVRKVNLWQMASFSQTTL